MRIVTYDGKVLCEDIDYSMSHGEPVLTVPIENGRLVQLWEWLGANPFGRYERWVVSDGALSPLADQDQDVMCECSVCHYKMRATPGATCLLQGMKGPCKGVMNPIEE